jgi:peptidoglycan biosynthesis protein MviN/MurJ (putative lipid II flippase)
MIYAFRSPIGIAMGAAITAPIGSFVNAYPNKKLLNYSFGEQMKDFLPSFALAVVMGIVVYLTSGILTNEFAMSPILQLVVLTAMGALLYFGMAKLFRLECLDYLMKTAKEVKNRKKR